MDFNEELGRAENIASDVKSTLSSMTSNMDSLDMTPEIMRNTNEQMEFNEELQKSSTLADQAKGMIKGMVGAYLGVQGVKAFVGTADELTMINARINNMKSSSESLGEVQNKIFASAQRSRGDYLATMDAVAKLGSQAGEAFNNTDEIIDFAEQLNKNFVLSGTSIEGANSAMYQLNQAMASGVLRGEEFNAIRENAPSVVQAIADYMGVAKGEVKGLADQGMLSADIVKNAMLASAQATNEAFGKIPMTFGQIKQATINTFVRELQPALERFNQFLNTAEFGNFVNNASIAFGVLANVVGVVVETGITGFNFMAEAINVLQAPLIGAIAIMGLYNGILLAKSIAEGISAFQTKVMEMGLWGAMTAQLGLNTAILASPIFWIPALIIGIIALIYGAVAAVNHFQGTTVSATGIIVGVIYTAIAYVINQFINFGNHVITIAENSINTFRRFGEFLGNFAKHPLEATLRLFERFAQNVLNILKTLASSIDSVFGSNLAGVVEGWQSGLSARVEASLPSDYKKVDDIKLERIQTINLKSAFDSGYKTGTNFENNIKGAVDKLFKNPAMEGQNNLANQTANTMADLPAKIGEGNKGMADLPAKIGEGNKGMGKDLAKVKDNTKDIKKTLENEIEFKNEDLKYLREMATERAISQYSLDKVMVEVNNQFGDVHENVDLDGWQTGLVDGLKEAIETGIGGVGIVETA